MEESILKILLKFQKISHAFNYVNNTLAINMESSIQYESHLPSSGLFQSEWPHNEGGGFKMATGQRFYLENLVGREKYLTNIFNWAFFSPD